MNNKPVNVSLVYTSDIHGHIMPLNYGTNETSANGLARYATAVKQIRNTHDHLIIIDNGDLIQGTPLMTHYVKEHAHKANPMIQAMNKINIDASVIGNHEFNFGQPILRAAMDQSNFPWLAANVLDAETNEPKYGPPYIIKKLQNGIKIAILGVTTHYIPNWESPEHIAGIHFRDAYETVKTWVPSIHKKEQPDLLIVSYHGGFERDIHTGEATEALTGENQGYAICNIEGVDVLLTGHQHRQLTDIVNDVLVIQPGNNAFFYGKVDIQFTKCAAGWEMIDKKASLHTLAQTPPDKEIVNLTKEIEASTQQWLDQPVGYIKGDMTINDPFQARIRKHPFIEFIQKVQMEVSGADISVTALLNNNSKGFNQTVTMRDVVANYMYPNTLVVLELQGKDIRAALEKSAAYFMLNENGDIVVNPAFEKPKPQHYNYDMWEGITYTINIAKPIGSRVEKLCYRGDPITTEESYHVVLNNYRASGGGDYSMFKNKPVVKEIQKDTVELIQTYFEKHPTVDATVTDNFKIIAEA
ncbi:MULTISPECIES: bifunctional UDP-sugar hydrolase/5'-nucleotidase [Clostridia]|uniref:bifunctional metallophosphatase/5'-nucleotidase n=1 Tax=Clostridia TaxID=186801 RepID=UPI0018F7725B|nr:MULTISPECIES: bifunctional UDP-sugar hydrolase/5'-nucleotidase [Clostridia]